MIQGVALTVVLAFIVSAFFIMDFYFMFRYDRDRKVGGKGWAWDYTLFTIALGLVVLLQPILFPKIGWVMSAVPGLLIQMVGGLSVALSFALHIWARQHLRHFYTERVEVQDGHQVVDTGPYSLMRHPIITSFFLLAGGVFLINPAVTTILAFMYVLADFNKAARQEEVLLSGNVPGYSEYMMRVPRFFPRLWMRK
jgi:protein-S-isoprenylcysteine O-methyltransferase Ste14